MAVIDVLTTGGMIVSSAVYDRSSKKGRFAYTGIMQKLKSRKVIPVKAYLITVNGRKVLVDTGWSEQCAINARKHLGSALYFSSRPVMTLEQSINRRLAKLGVKAEDLDAVILTHFDCDHISGLHLVKNAKNIYASQEEIDTAQKVNPRYYKKLWKNVDIKPLKMDYNSKYPFGKSCDLFGDSSVVVVFTPGHSAGCVCVEVNDNGKTVLIAGDNGYCEKSWSELILSGPLHNIHNMKITLMWIDKIYKSENCVGVFTAHDDSNKERIEF